MKNVADVYKLSPMQEFMLLHSVARRESDVLFDQFCFEIEHPLDVDAFHAAWQDLLDRHTILRTAFVWEKVKNPLQVVRAKLAVPFELLDWSALAPGEQRQRFAELRAADRARGFNLGKAPLLRLHLVRLAAQRFYLLWSSHHLLLDRWCLGTLLPELDHLYAARSAGRTPALAPSRPYREYIEWIDAQDRAQAEQYWRTHLAGFSAPTETTRPRPEKPATQTLDASLALDEDFSATARRFARHNGLTFSVLVQGAWALVLNRLANSQDVVIGIAGAGRPADLPGVESILGCFINNLPRRVRLSAAQGQLAYLKSLQALQTSQQRFEHVSPLDLVAWSELGGSRNLFDHLLVWLSPVASADSPALAMRSLPGEHATAYPLTLTVNESAQALQFNLRLTPSHETVTPLAQILDTLMQVLGDLIDGPPERPLGDLAGFVGTRDFADITDTGQALLAAMPSASVEAAPVATAGRCGSELDMLEDMLEAHWADALGVPTLDRQASVFDLGASSLSAAAVHLRVETSTRKSVPMLALYRDPSIEGMARTLMESDWPLKTSWSSTAHR